MKNKLVALTLIALASGLTLGACNVNGGSSDTPDTTPDSSVLPDSPDESTPDSTPDTPDSSEEDPGVPATRVKITQPDLLTVGDTLNVKEIVEFTPANADVYSVVSQDEDVAVVENNEIIRIVGSGSTKVNITVPTSTGKARTLGSINIKALSQEGKALQTFADALSNHYKVTGTWDWVEGKKWADVTDGDSLVEGDLLGLVVNPNYVFDFVYGQYSAIALEKDEGNAHAYTLLDENGEALFGDGMTGTIDEELAKAASVEIGDRVSSAYIQSYFVIENLLDVTLFKEDVRDNGDVYFYTDNAVDAIGILGGLLGMNVSSFTGYRAEVWLDDGLLKGEVKFDDPSDADLFTFEVTAGEDADIAVLEDAVKNAEPPVALDVTELADHFAQFDGNFVVEWELGLFTRDGYFNPVEGFYQYNSVGTSYYNNNTLLYGYAKRDAETGEVDIETASYNGYQAGDAGIFGVALDAEGVFTAGTTALSADIKQLNAVFPYGSDITKEVLEGASLTLKAEGTGYKYYTYDATFDNLALGAYLENLAPLGYGFSEDSENASYIEAHIIDYGTAIQIMFLERVRLSETETAYQGVVLTVYGADTVTFGVGSTVADVFPEFQPEPETPVTPDPDSSESGEEPDDSSESGEEPIEPGSDESEEGSEAGSEA